MIDHQRTREAYARVQHDLRQEQAAALARIAGTLDELLARLSRSRRALDAAGGADRARHAETYARLREQTRRYRWYLEVQREAIGLRRHDVLDELYPIPGPLTE